MTTTDYKEKYEAALERCKKLYNEAKANEYTSDIEDYETIFPELKESEDEKIRKCLLRHFSRYQAEEVFLNDIKMGDIVDWLEKQGEQKPVISDDALREGIAHFGITQYQIDNWLKKYVNVEKQGEQKPFDYENANIQQKDFASIEPKFKVGDWIVFNGLTLYVNEVVQGYYRTTSIGGIPNSYDWDIDNVARLWTIQDAKDGDFLAFKNNIGGIIICKSPTNYDTRSYCRLISDNLINKEENGWDSTQIVPATKEQREQLERAMADVGYTFDFDKKELKKIVVPIFKIGDTIIKKHNSDIRDFGSFVITDITGGKYWYNDRIICDISEQDEWELYEPVRQNTAWSEEDEKCIDELIKFFDSMKDCLAVEERHQENRRWLNFLKSLKGTNIIQLPQEWSIEDNIRLQEAIRIVQNYHNNIKDEYLFAASGWCLGWLKSLKSRLQLQPKQEWSEEDERTYKSVLYAFEHRFPLNCEQQKFVKSLRSKKQWKPSEEQIKALEWQVANTSKDSWQGKATKELLEQFKNLI